MTTGSENLGVNGGTKNLITPWLEMNCIVPQRKAMQAWVEARKHIIDFAVACFHDSAGVTLLVERIAPGIQS